MYPIGYNNIALYAKSTLPIIFFKLGCYYEYVTIANKSILLVNVTNNLEVSTTYFYSMTGKQL
jgi:hypothetical protein